LNGKENLIRLVQAMTPRLNSGTYVFVTVKDANNISRSDTICEFKEEEGTTIVLEQSKADALRFQYELNWPNIISVVTSLRAIITTIFLWVAKTHKRQSRY